jgi:hypothetical protein
LGGDDALLAVLPVALRRLRQGKLTRDRERKRFPPMRVREPERGRMGAKPSKRGKLQEKTLCDALARA